MLVVPFTERSLADAAARLLADPASRVKSGVEGAEVRTGPMSKSVDFIQVEEKRGPVIDHLDMQLNLT
jgi:hypothetical protein